jgi:hypothetical protein
MIGSVADNNNPDPYFLNNEKATPFVWRITPVYLQYFAYQFFSNDPLSYSSHPPMINNFLLIF